MPSAILKKILQNSSNCPNKTAVKFQEKKITYKNLKIGINDCKNFIQTHNINISGLDIENSPQWICFDLALLDLEITNIPIPFFFSSNQKNHLIADSKLNFIITDKPEEYLEKGYLIESNFNLFGKALFLIKIREDGLNIGVSKITYTSGTTGNPKGVCLTEENLSNTVISIVESLDIDSNDVHFSSLPFSVLLENIAGVYLPLIIGAQIFIPPRNLLDFGSPSVDYQSIVLMMNEARATTTIFVPQQFYLFVNAAKKNNALDTMRYIAVGGASVSKLYLSLAEKLNIPVFQGYGMSESASVISINNTTNNKLGTVGKPLSHIDIKIDTDGEILIKGNLFKGYLNSDQLIVDKNGYFKTGDIGEFDNNGYLSIIGRKKNVFVNSYGRNISPEWIEEQLSSFPEILQSAVFGESQSSCSAVIYSNQFNKIDSIIEQINLSLPDYARIQKWIKAKEPFLMENKQLRPSGVVDRSVIWHLYKGKLFNYELGNIKEIKNEKIL